MSTTTQKAGSQPVRPATPAVPPLQAGDHLSAEEFERRYDAMPELKKSELIEGVVYMGSPVSIDDHGEPDSDIAGWLWVYKAHTPGTQTGVNATVRLDSKNRPQPDNQLRIRPDHGGRTTTVDKYVVGGPELTSEVSASSVGYDLHEKLDSFWRNGVQEYVVWRVQERAIDWFIRGTQQYERLAPEVGVYKSRVFPGLWLDADAMLTGNMANVLAVLQQGLATPEHAAFCRELQRRRDALAAGS